MKSQPGSDLGEHLGGGININLELVTNILMNFKLILIWLHKDNQILDGARDPVRRKI